MIAITKETLALKFTEGISERVLRSGDGVKNSSILCHHVYNYHKDEHSTELGQNKSLAKVGD